MCASSSKLRLCICQGVICLEFGAQHAANSLVAAGVDHVLWVSTDAIFEPASCARLLSIVLAPAFHFLNAGNSPESVSNLVKTKLIEANLTGTAGCCCNDDAIVVQWQPKSNQNEQWLRNIAPEPLRLEPRGKLQAALSAALPLLAVDLGVLRLAQLDLEQRGASGKLEPTCSVMVLPPDGQEKDANALLRCRAVALALCTSHLYGSTYKLVCRISTLKDLQDLEGQLDGLKFPALVWLDFCGHTVPWTKPDLDLLRASLRPTDEGKNSAVVAARHILLTYADAESKDLAYSLSESLDLGVLHLAAADEHAQGVHADGLHEEFKVLTTFEMGEPKCLLDAFEPKILEEALNQLLDGRPVVGMYRADEPSACYIRICISDVGFLHKLRDSMLTGQFGSDLQDSLRAKQRRQDDGQDSLGDISVSIDRTQFAEKYESSVLRLDKLTEHQREKMEECQQAGVHIHIKAPAGAGKTFVALHYVKACLEQGENILFIARNLPLVLFVSKWIAQKYNGLKRGQILSQVHLMYDPLQEGPRRVQLGNDGRLRTSVVRKRDQYDLVVVDEAHHIFRIEKLRAHAQPFVDSSATSRFLLLSDVSQANRSDIKFPSDPLQPCKEVILTEVVRNSKRIVAGVKQFQVGGQDGDDRENETKCAHDSDGPPLKSFLFDVGPDEDRFEKYSAQVMEAMEAVTDEFEGLRLHDRLAIIVPDEAFRSNLAPVLSAYMEKQYPKIKLVTAEVASSSCGELDYY